MKFLTDEDQTTLDQLNTAVTEAIAKRTAWLDSKMEEYAEVQVGEALYDMSKKEYLGEVTGLYRYWRDRDDNVRDKSLSIEYNFRTARNHSGNTSSKSIVSVGTRAQYLQRLQNELEWERQEALPVEEQSSAHKEAKSRADMILGAFRNFGRERDAEAEKTKGDKHDT